MDTAQRLKILGYANQISLEDLASPTNNIQQLLSYEVADRLSNCGCLFPDHPDEELANSYPEELARYLNTSEENASCIRLAHLRMLEAQTGQGSWPAGCHPNLFSNRHAVKYYVRRSTFNNNYLRAVTDTELSQIWDQKQWQPWNDWKLTREALFDNWAGKPALDVCLWLVEETFRRVGCWHEPTDNEREANIVILSRPIGGSTIGIGWFNSGTCRDRVEFHIDSTWRPPSLHAMTNLFSHECGHCNNLPHTFTNQQSHHGVMSYSTPSIYQGFSTGQAPHTLPRDPSLSQLIRQYGNEWVPFAETPNPPEPPKPNPPDTDIEKIIAEVLKKIPTKEEIVKEVLENTPTKQQIVADVLSQIPYGRIRQEIINMLPIHFKGPKGDPGGFSSREAEYVADTIRGNLRGFFSATTALQALQKAFENISKK